MSLFKEKTHHKSNNVNEQRLTIDAIHNIQLDKFEKSRNNVDELTKMLTDAQEKYKILNEIPRQDLTDEQLDETFILRDQMDTLEKNLASIIENQEEYNYLLDTGHLLFHYYDKFKGNKSASGKHYKSSEATKKNVLDFFHTKQQGSPKSLSPTDTTSPTPTHDYSKSEIINNYLSKIDDNFVCPFDYEDSLEYCQQCNKERTVIPSEGIVVCTNCGFQDSIIIDSDKPSYKDPPREISYFAYKRINHFNEWLAQFQAKESTEIPKEVFDRLLIEIKKERISNMATLSTTKLREILKKLRLNKYYEHVPHIINRLNGLPAPVMTRETEEKLRMMFKEIQTPFLKYCPRNRKNFLSYAYVLHKFVQLLEMDEFLVCFPLLKSREKLHQQDQIWKKICEELQWEFIKSL
jgi:hypothetical protein